MALPAKEVTRDSREGKPPCPILDHSAKVVAQP